MAEEKTPLTETTGKLKLIAAKNFAAWDDMYQVVDFLNKSLKEYHLMFGLKREGTEKMTVTVYEV